MGRFNIAKFEKPKAHNEWAEDVAELDEQVKADPEFAATFTIPAADEGKTLTRIREAAAELNRTVRILARDDSKASIAGTTEKGRRIFAGEVTLSITLRDKYADGRGRPKGSTVATEATDKPKK